MQERRLELLRRRIAERGLGAAPARIDQPAIRAGERYRLSMGQRRMWFMQALDAADTTLNICLAYRLTGPLDPQRFREAFNQVVARHAILRTTYGVDAEGEPYQEFCDEVEIAWQEQDLSGLSEHERSPRLEALAQWEFGRPFDLTVQMPMRVTLLHCGAEEFVLLLTVHHICWDDDCWAPFFGELSAAYNGRPRTAPAPQFVAVEALKPAVEPTNADVDYWRRTLQPLPDPPDLPGPAAMYPSRQAQRRSRAMPAELLSRVKEFARQRSATPFMVLLAGFGALMRRYSGTSDLLVAVPVTDRKAAAENALGYFGNTLLLRLTPAAHHTFTSLVDEVRRTCLDGFAHQSVGIDRVIREANPSRSSGRDGSSVVQLGFSVRKDASGFTLDDVATCQLALGANSTQVPLALAVVPDAGIVEFAYHTDLFGIELVDQMLGHYLRLLDHAVSEPGHRLAALNLFGTEELLTQSRGEPVPTSATTVVALLDAAVPGRGATAVVSDDTELSYQDLNARVNRLARWMIGQGIGTEDVVGLQIAGSVEFVVAMLAVLKSGAAYVPIDPAYPLERIEYMIADSGPRLVIGTEDFDAAERAAAELPDDAVSDADRNRPLHPENLAYIIYTSGSTGRPKGVAVSHRAIAEHLEGFGAQWSMTAEDRLLQSTSVSFDASVAEILLTLTLGATLVVPKLTGATDFSYLAEVIERHRVTVVQLVPSALRSVLDLPPLPQWRQLRHLPVGGEALPGELIDRFAGHFDAELRNHYGPTEAVVCATHMPVKGSYGSRVVPIGVPNCNVFAYVLDDQLQPVPAEVVGELYLGGVQLARGYLGRPAMTAERFVADPFNPGMRLFRSGDLVRRSLTGELEFVGRADEQVKIRGFRIELGEVGSAIATHAAVRQCVVVVEEADSGPKLAAYLLSDAELDLDEIQTHVASLLPNYMVPKSFAVLTEIPLTPAGKLDKRALPATTRIAAGGYRVPATTTEHRVCEIFARLFGEERVGADDSFFELGGHSLLAARLVAQIRADFGVDLAVRAVFDTPTPAGLAATLVTRFRDEFDIDLDEMDAEGDLDDTAAEPGGPQRPDLAVSARPDQLPLSYSQLAAWFQYRLEGPHDGFNLPLALHFHGPLDTALLSVALNDVVARHEALRTRFIEHDGVPYQVVAPELTIELAIEPVAADMVDAAIERLRREVMTPETAPLIRATLLAVDPSTHVLLLNVHHIVSDHTSLGIIFDDLTSAYQARRAGSSPQWADLPVQFADYALWQLNAFDPANAWGQQQVAHWRATLAGLPQETCVATDHPRPPVIGKRGHSVHFPVSSARRASLVQLAEDTGASEFMVYQAAVAVLLHKLGAGTELALGSTVASRVDAATSNLVGLFANVVVLRNDLSGTPSLRTVLRRGRDTVLDAVAHQELPIERLVEAINPSRSLSRNPLFQHMVHFRGPDWGLQPRDLTGETSVVPRPIDFDIALLDLDIGMNVTAAGGLEVRVVANADLYEAATVGLIADALRAVLDGFAETPDRPISELTVLPDDQLTALLAPAIPTDAGSSGPAVAGSAETERILIDLLEELLEITDVEREDNFFALGGDSIISIKWSAQASARGLVLTPAMVFEHMTIAGLAAAVDRAADTEQEPTDMQTNQDYTPMSASGLDADALAALTAAWQQQP
ncbi:non-ribosomal peptide synthetase [Mycolicibacterium sp. GF69]|uniref:non-ribosomal peptide synthetase n=1 Tax=Mycolicibacterium sp. GF69 TaxID=2267251 RepID=UPI000DCF0619|nr:non-ribosomal peptide synthetase [Mycolicibacterium sp. GF69]RAV07389.1 non-ribosomal peptide synthetase [Mycolicibacterium sp. GF69]